MFVCSPFNIISHSERLARCGAPGVRGGWHAPCLVARGQRTRSRQGHKQTESESVDILSRRGLFHRMVTLGQVMNCSASEHMDDNHFAKDRIRMSVARALFRSAVPPASGRDGTAARARHTARMSTGSRQRWVWRRGK